MKIPATNLLAAEADQWVEHVSRHGYSALAQIKRTTPAMIILSNPSNPSNLPRYWRRNGQGVGSSSDPWRIDDIRALTPDRLDELEGAEQRQALQSKARRAAEDLSSRMQGRPCRASNELLEEIQRTVSGWLAHDDWKAL
ncbi:MAG: hypothetical protein GY719_26075 [bacterium]|nr:hypothetical protein [bacterium]